MVTKRRPDNTTVFKDYNREREIVLPSPTDTGIHTVDETILIAVWSDDKTLTDMIPLTTLYANVKMNTVRLNEGTLSILLLVGTIEELFRTPFKKVINMFKLPDLFAMMRWVQGKLKTRIEYLDIANQNVSQSFKATNPEGQEITKTFSPQDVSSAGTLFIRNNSTIFPPGATGPKCIAHLGAVWDLIHRRSDYQGDTVANIQGTIIADELLQLCRGGQTMKTSAMSASKKMNGHELAMLGAGYLAQKKIVISNPTGANLRRGESYERNAKQALEELKKRYKAPGRCLAEHIATGALTSEVFCGCLQRMNPSMQTGHAIMMSDIVAGAVSWDSSSESEAMVQAYMTAKSKTLPSYEDFDRYMLLKFNLKGESEAALKVLGMTKEQRDGAVIQRVAPDAPGLILDPAWFMTIADDVIITMPQFDSADTGLSNDIPKLTDGTHGRTMWVYCGAVFIA